MEAEIVAAEIIEPLEIVAPARQTLPLVFASPHSGSRYPPDFVDNSRLGRLALRRSEDSFVDEIFTAAPEMGAPLLRALFPRAYVDPNREPFELDPAMFRESLPDYVNSRSPRVAAGLGTIARVVANGAEIYQDKIPFSEAMHRIRRCYWPYHSALRHLIDITKKKFGYCILIDCHSMPSIGGPSDRDPGRSRVDFVLGDCHGAACDSLVIKSADAVLRSFNHVVAYNAPYSGGYITRHYGRPKAAVHGLQIEINRTLYMDEENIRRGAGLLPLSEQMRSVIGALAQIDPRRLRNC